MNTVIEGIPNGVIVDKIFPLSNTISYEELLEIAIYILSNNKGHMVSSKEIINKYNLNEVNIKKLSKEIEIE